jgi:hypothetical protein
MLLLTVRSCRMVAMLDVAAQCVALNEISVLSRIQTSPGSRSSIRYVTCWTSLRSRILEIPNLDAVRGPV